MKPNRNYQFDDLEQLLRIDEHALETECAVQAESFYRVAKILALEISRRDAKKMELEEVEARCDGRIRHEAEHAEQKITEPKVKALISLDASVKKVNEELLQLNLSVAKLSALKEAFQQRSFILRELVQLYICNYYGDATNISNRNIAREALSRVRRSE